MEDNIYYKVVAIRYIHVYVVYRLHFELVFYVDLKTLTSSDKTRSIYKENSSTRQDEYMSVPMHWVLGNLRHIGRPFYSKAELASGRRLFIFKKVLVSYNQHCNQSNETNIARAVAFDASAMQKHPPHRQWTLLRTRGIGKQWYPIFGFRTTVGAGCSTDMPLHHNPPQCDPCIVSLSLHQQCTKAWFRPSPFQKYRIGHPYRNLFGNRPNQARTRVDREKPETREAAQRAR